VRVLDTDTCVELLRGNLNVMTRRAAVVDQVVTTWFTAAELYFGAARSREPDQNRSLVDQFLDTLDVLGIDRPAAQFFGQRKAGLEDAGRPLPDADLLIGSIVVARDAVLVTGNLRHFARFHGLRLENWIR